MDLSNKIATPLDIVYTGWTKKNVSLLQTKTLGTSYSETTNLLDLKLWQQGVWATLDGTLVHARLVQGGS